MTDSETRHKNAIINEYLKNKPQPSTAVLKTAITDKKNELQGLLATANAKVKDKTAITNKTGWEAWESEEGIKQWIKHLKKDIQWCDDNTPTT